VISLVGRDPKYEQKLQAFEATPSAERGPKKRPIKHKFPKGFHRGIELFGQQRGRLEEPGYRKAISRYGLIVGVSGVRGQPTFSLTAPRAAS